MLREMVFARFFGASELISAFRIAFLVPNLARRLFGEGTLSAALVPALAQALEDKGPEAARRLLGGTIKVVAAVLTGIVLLVEVALWATRANSHNLIFHMTFITSTYMPIVCIVALLGAALNVYRRFAVPAGVPFS